MIVQKVISPDTPLSESQKKMLEELKVRAAKPDEECPELSPEQLSQMQKLSQTRREERRKQTVTLRLSPQALSKAKTLGKGYTSVLSRILENALKDNETIKRFL